MKKGLSIILLLFVFAISKAQDNKFEASKDARRWMVGVQGGTSFITGDADKIKLSYSGGIHAQYSISHTFGFRVIGNYANLQGGAQKSTATKFGLNTFESDNKAIEGQLQAVFNLSNLSFIRKSRRWGAYFFAGGGAIFNNGTSKYSYIGSTTQQGDTFKKSIGVVGLGLGVKFNATDLITIGLEFGTRYTLSDSIDLLNARVFANRSKDLYHLPQLFVSFKLGKSGKKHLDWINPVASMYDKIETVEKKIDKLDKDSDNDGVSDRFDKEPNTPAGVKVYGNGESVDSDGDGIPDSKDIEPNTPKGAEVDKTTGKSIDSDNDGVPDGIDLSPNTDVNKYITNHQGIPIISKDDAANITKGGGKIGYLPAIFFATNEVDPYPVHLNDLQQIAISMNTNTGLKLEIIGNTDVRSSSAYNNKLALQRAENIKHILVNQFGVDASRLEVKSNGESTPITKGTRSIDHQANRRVQFFIKK